MSYDLWKLSLAVCISGILSALFTWLCCRSSLQQERENLRVRIAEVTSEKNSLTEKLHSLAPALRAAESENQQLKIRISQLEQMRTTDAEKIQWMEGAQVQMRDAFAALAGQTLQKNSELFISRAREQMDLLLNRAKGDWHTHKAELQNIFDPVRENLYQLQGHVRELEQKREGAYRGLSEQIQQLARAHSEIRAATVTLTQALKSPTVRGRWGEIQLRRVVEMSGMVRHIAFTEQATADWGRPDMIVYLPNGGILPVDSKVPLRAYLAANETQDPREQKVKMQEHARAMRSRIRELSRKKYWDQFENAPDFVVMFLPGDGCLSAAFDHDPDLLEYAMSQRILLSTPLTLIALLKAVAYGWKQQQVTENARRIAQQGQELCKRLEIFMGHFSDLKNHLNKSVDGYNKTLASLEKRLLPIARRFQEMDITDSEPEIPDEIANRAREIFGKL
ncbi:MAG: DNA recombination protein RmuC [Desulfococcaceae bacterium]|jgi:DNA recombination protein RmuC|nr:DNA recombination protein RmuC [Desulfococcaceae bacterium]